MIAVQAFIDRNILRVANDTDATYGLAAATPPTVALVKEPFTPSPSPGALTLADFVGSSAIPLTAGVQQVLNNPVTRGKGVGLVGSAPFVWVCTSAPMAAQTIYGWAIINSDDGVLATQLLPEPVVIQQVGDFVEVPAEFGFWPSIPFGPSQ